MYVSTFRMRARSPEAAAEICQYFRRALPMKLEPGYLRGDCTVNTADHCDVFIAEVWGSVEAWQAWDVSDARRQLTTHLEALVVGNVDQSLYVEV